MLRKLLEVHYKVKYLIIGDLNGNIIKNVEQYKYLGTINSKERISKRDKAHRINQAKYEVQKLNSIFWLWHLTKRTEKLTGNMGAHTKKSKQSKGDEISKMNL